MEARFSYYFLAKLSHAYLITYEHQHMLFQWNKSQWLFQLHCLTTKFLAFFQNQRHWGWRDTRVTWRGALLLAHKPGLGSGCESLSTSHALRVISSETGWGQALFSLNIFGSHKINAYLALSINNTLYLHNILVFFILHSKYTNSSPDPWRADMVIQYLICPILPSIVP